VTCDLLASVLGYSIRLNKEKRWGQQFNRTRRD